MDRIEHAAQTTQQERDHQRWADDGGFIPGREMSRPTVPTRSPWRAVGIAAAVGFAVGWLTASSSRGGR